MERFFDLVSVLRRRPNAWAHISGSKDYPALDGTVQFYQNRCGVLVAAEVRGLPQDGDGFFGFHIHSGDRCSGNETDPFADAMTHYNPESNPHPAHAGDLPPLLGANGYALQIFLTDRFSVREVLGKTIIIHASPDDFTTQPTGNAGKKIACGVIESPTCR